MIQTTVDSLSAAQEIARRLVDAKLAACVQISSDISSIYVWQGRVEEAVERQLWIKTHPSLEPALEAFLKEIHPYSEPEYLVFEPTKVSASFSKWVAEVLAV